MKQYFLRLFVWLVFGFTLASAAHSFPAVLTGVDSSGFAAWSQNEGDRCAAWAKGAFDTCTVDAYIGPTEPPAWVLRQTAHPAQTWSTYRATGYMSCPSNAINNGTGQCSCGAGLVVSSSNDSCVSSTPPPPPVVTVDPVKVLNTSGSQIKYDSTKPQTEVCYSGHVVAPTMSGCTLDGHCVATGPFTDTGASCGSTGGGGTAPAPTPNTDPPLGTPSNCAAGLIPGEVNGKGVCLKPSVGNTVKSETSSGTTTTAGADGVSGTPTVAPDKKVTTETSCTGEACTTKTTTTSRDASGTFTVQKEVKSENKDDFCTRNKSAPVCSESQAVDTAMPTAPKLYEPAFPRGISGVWADRKAQLTSAPLSGLMSNLMPSVASGGSCPSMMINLNITSWAMFGVRDVAPPCYIWDFGKVVIILSALLLARSLIFGG